MTKQSLDYEQIINEAAEKLEARFAEIQNELAPLREEERDVAEAIHRIVGSYPAGYQAPVARAPRAPRAAAVTPRQAPEDREAQALAIVQNHPEGITAKAVSEELGVSPATGTKVINSLLESNQIVSQGERRSRRLLPA